MTWPGTRPLREGVRRGRELASWAMGRRRRYRVDGTSMSPGLRDGDHILVDTAAYRARPPAQGDVIVLRHPFRKDVYMVKRVARLDDGGRVVLEGDRPEESTDSRSLGSVDPSEVVGKMSERL